MACSTGLSLTMSCTFEARRRAAVEAPCRVSLESTILQKRVSFLSHPHLQRHGLNVLSVSARPNGRPRVCQSLFGLGLPELAIIGGVAIVLFGPKKLPEIGKSLGKTVKSFQEAAKEFSTELKEAAKSDDASPGAGDAAVSQKTAAEASKEEAKK